MTYQFAVRYNVCRQLATVYSLCVAWVAVTREEVLPATVAFVANWAALQCPGPLPFVVLPTVECLVALVAANAAIARTQVPTDKINFERFIK